MKSLIQTPTPGLKDSLDFYRQLDFQILSESNPTIVSDGKAVIEINPDRTARAGVKLFAYDWQRELAELRRDFPIHALDNGFLVGDPSGVWVYLIRGSGVEVELKEKSFAVTGSFAGLSIETIDIARSQELWQILGFEPTAGDADKGWVSLSNGELTISLMAPLACPHLFFNPSLTYFNGNQNLQVIDQIRKRKIDIAEEITVFNEEGKVDNIIIQDPGGLGAFLFND
ncbi:hypothetical protein [Halocola ammonii]